MERQDIHWTNLKKMKTEDMGDKVLDEGHETFANFLDLVFRSSVTYFHQKTTVTR